MNGQEHHNLAEGLITQGRALLAQSTENTYSTALGAAMAMFAEASVHADLAQASWAREAAGHLSTISGYIAHMGSGS